LKKTWLNVIKFLVFLTVGLVILYLVYRGQNAKFISDCAEKGIPSVDCNLLEKVWIDMREANYWWILAILIAFLLSNVSRALRWMMLIRQLGNKGNFFNAFFTIMLGYFANLGIPRMGEILRPAMYARYERIPVEKVIGTVVVDRAMDVLSLLTAIGLAFILQFNVLYSYTAAHIRESPLLSKGFLILVIAGFLFLIGMWIFRKRITNTGLYQKIQHIVQGFIEGIRTIMNLERPWIFIFHTVFIWFMYYLMTYLCFSAFEPTAHLTPLAGLVVFVMGGLGIVFPSPGGMGTYHAMLVAGLTIYGVSGDDAFSFANIIYFSVQLFCNIFFGILALIVLPLYNQKRTHVSET
jgi:uncharacterized protein (TIRG00374 family)